MFKLPHLFSKSPSLLIKLSTPQQTTRNFAKHVKVGHDWRDLLETWSVQEIIRKRPFVGVRSDNDIATLQKTLNKNGVLAAVVIDEAKKPDTIAGIADVLDWVHEMTRDLSEKSSRDELAKRGRIFFAQTCASLMNASGKDPVVKVLATDSLSEAVDMLEAVHRVVAYDASLRPIGIVAQSDIISHMLAIFDFWKSLLDMPLTSGESSHGEVLTVKDSDSVIKALKLMKANKVQGIAVVNDSKELVTNLSASDFLNLSEDSFSLLALSVKEYLDEVHGYLNPPIYVKDGFDSYHTIMLKMKYYGVHRVYVLDKQKHPVKVITTTDIMKVLANPENQTIMLPKKF